MAISLSTAKSNERCHESKRHSEASLSTQTPAQMSVQQPEAGAPRGGALQWKLGLWGHTQWPKNADLFGKFPQRALNNL